MLFDGTIDLLLYLKTGFKYKTRILKFSIYTKLWTVPYRTRRGLTLQLSQIKRITIINQAMLFFILAPRFFSMTHF